MGTSLTMRIWRRTKDYQKWKKQVLSHKGSAAQWNKLNDDKSINVKVQWDKGTTSKVTDYKWDKSGHLTNATLTLGKQTGDSNASAANGYIHEENIKDDDQRKAYVYSHEMAHVEYAQKPGSEEVLTTFHENGQTIQKGIDAAGGTTKAFKDPALRQLNDQQLKQGYELEKGADERAWEAINE